MKKKYLYFSLMIMLFLGFIPIKSKAATDHTHNYVTISTSYQMINDTYHNKIQVKECSICKDRKTVKKRARHTLIYHGITVSCKYCSYSYVYEPLGGAKRKGE